MKFRATVEIEVERTEGKFARRDELEEQIIEALESADPSDFSGDNGGLYQTVSWEVTLA